MITHCSIKEKFFPILSKRKKKYELFFSRSIKQKKEEKERGKKQNLNYQLLGPEEKGIQACKLLSPLFDKNLSGINFSGSGQFSGS